MEDLSFFDQTCLSNIKVWQVNVINLGIRAKSTSSSAAGFTRSVATLMRFYFSQCHILRGISRWFKMFA